MSFGFSVGDFIAALQLANKIRKDFVGAPSQFESISNEVRSLSIILQDIDVNLTGHDLSDQQQTHLKEISDSCHNVLNELEKTVAKYQDLEYTGGSLSKKVKRTWKRIKWEPEDIRELRDRITSNVSLLNTFLGGILNQTTLETKCAVNQLILREDDQERLRVLDWLTTTDYALQQREFISRRQFGTGQWLLDSDEYRKWRQTSNKTLFCPGMPGAGKTFLTAIVIEDLTTQFQGDDIGIAYFYCNFQRQDEQTVDKLLASLLKQLCQRRLSLPDTVTNLYNQHKNEGIRPSLEDISSTIQSVCATYSKVFIVIDALDECRASGCRTRLLSEIFEVQARCGVNVFATSRSIPEINEKFQGTSVSLEIRASKEDVRRYLDGQMSDMPDFVSQNIKLQDEIKSGIVRIVQGMFLLAQLYLESLLGEMSIKAIRVALTKLPTAVDEYVYDLAYKGAMERIEGQLRGQTRLAKQVLAWITCAKRPLTPLELQHALAVEHGEPELDEENLPYIKDIISVCAGLVTIDNESNVIRLVHYTVQEYFERTQHHWFPDAETWISTTCITYLSFRAFEDGACSSEADLEERLRLHAFFRYASQNWGHHARAVSTPSIGMLEAMSKLLENVAMVQAANQGLMATKTSRVPLRHRYPKHVTGLHLAGYFGLREAARMLLVVGKFPDVSDSWCRTPLLLAAANGHFDVAKLLVDTQMVRADCSDYYGNTPLLEAVKGDHYNVVKLLVNTHEVDINSANLFYKTPLLCAIDNDNDTIIQFLLGASKGGLRFPGKTSGLDTVPEHSFGLALLQRAIHGGYYDAVRLNMKEFYDEVRGRKGEVTLQYAARYGHDSVVQVLLATGDVDSDSKTTDGLTPLFLAAENGHAAVVRLLLESGRVDVNFRDARGRTPLFQAARNGHDTIVEMLLSIGKADF